MLYFALVLLIHLSTSTLVIWLAAKISWVRLTVKDIAVIVILVTAFAFLPHVGFLLSLILFIFLVMRLSGCSAFDAAAVALFAKLFAFAGASTLR